MTTTSTLEDLGTARASRRGRQLRRVGFGLLLVVVALGLAGVFGPRENTVNAEGDGYRLSVTYPAVARSGQPAPLEIRVDAPTGFRTPVEITLDPTVFELLDFQNWYPNPDKETRGASELSYEFEPPEGDRLTVHLDARVSPGLGLGPSKHWVAVVVAGREVARATYTTWVAP